MQTLNVNVLLDTSLNYGYSKESFMVADELDKVKISKGESWFIVENDPKQNAQEHHAKQLHLQKVHSRLLQEQVFV